MAEKDVVEDRESDGSRELLFGHVLLRTAIGRALCHIRVSVTFSLRLPGNPAASHTLAGEGSKAH